MTNYELLHHWFQHLASLSKEELSHEPFIWNLCYGDNNTGSDASSKQIEDVKPKRNPNAIPTVRLITTENSVAETVARLFAMVVPGED